MIIMIGMAVYLNFYGAYMYLFTYEFQAHQNILKSKTDISERKLHRDAVFSQLRKNSFHWNNYEKPVGCKSYPFLFCLVTFRGFVKFLS